MSFEVVDRGKFNVNPLKRGECSIGADGRLSFLAEDLAALDIIGFAIVLCDPATLRLAIRAPRDGEAHRAMTVQVEKTSKGRDTGRRGIAAGRAIKRMMLDPKVCTGRYKPTTKDDLAIVNLADIELGAAEEVETKAK